MGLVTPWSHYLPSSPGLSDSGLSCRGAGEQFGRASMAPRRLPTHALLLVSAGRGHYRGEPDDRPVKVVAPAAIWLFPGVRHHYGPDSDGGWQEHWVLFEGAAVRAYEGLQAWRRGQPVQTTGAGLQVVAAALFDELRAGTATPGRQAELLGAAICHALVGLTARHSGPLPEGGSLSAAAVVVQGALTPGSVSDRAQRAGQGVDALRSAVRAETSLSVHELVIRTRMDRAQHLLATTEMTVVDVARQVGYDDPAYFSRTFRARVGVPPSAFRRRAGR